LNIRTTYSVGNPDSDLGKAQNVAGVIPVDDPKPPLLIIGSPDIHT